MKLSVYVDGASRGNPGRAGIGVVVYDEGKRLRRKLYECIGMATNNVAEYMALIYGLQEALMLRADEVTVYTDSQLLARQVSGEYRVKDKGLLRLFLQVNHLQKGFKNVLVKHISRAENKEADKLANRAVDIWAGRAAAHP